MTERGSDFSTGAVRAMQYIHTYIVKTMIFTVPKTTYLFSTTPSTNRVNRQMVMAHVDFFDLPTQQFLTTRRVLSRLTTNLSIVFFITYLRIVNCAAVN